MGSASTAGTRSIPGLVGRVQVANADGPGWANPDDPGVEDRRIVGRDGRRYGPMPPSWLRYRGLYRHGDRVVLAYTVGKADVLEMPGLETDPAQPGVPIFARTLEIGPSTVGLSMRVARRKRPWPSPAIGRGAACRVATGRSC